MHRRATRPSQRRRGRRVQRLPLDDRRFRAGQRRHALPASRHTRDARRRRHTLRPSERRAHVLLPEIAQLARVRFACGRPCTSTARARKRREVQLHAMRRAARARRRVRIVVRNRRAVCSGEEWLAVRGEPREHGGVVERHQAKRGMHVRCEDIQNI